MTRLEAIDVSDPPLCAFTVDVGYDPNVKIPTACDADPENNLDSAVCNKDYASNIVRVAGIHATGVTGAIPLADITWSAMGSAGDSTELDVQIVDFADCSGSQITVVDEDGVNAIVSPTPTPMATIQIGSATIPPAEQRQLRLEALSVPEPGVAALTVDIIYDPGLVSPVGCDENPAAIFDMTLCNMSYGPDVVRFSAIRAAPGAVGNVPLADITFQAMGAPGECTLLSLEVPTFVDPDGNDISFNSQDGSICVAAVVTPTSRWDDPSAPASSGQAMDATVAMGGDGPVSLLTLVLSLLLFLPALMISAAANHPRQPTRRLLAGSNRNGGHHQSDDSLAGPDVR